MLTLLRGRGLLLAEAFCSLQVKSQSPHSGVNEVQLPHSESWEPLPPGSGREKITCSGNYRTGMDDGGQEHSSQKSKLAFRNQDQRSM